MLYNVDDVNHSQAPRRHETTNETIIYPTVIIKQVNRIHGLLTLPAAASQKFNAQTQRQLTHPAASPLIFFLLRIYYFAPLLRVYSIIIIIANNFQDAMVRIFHLSRTTGESRRQREGRRGRFKTLRNISCRRQQRLTRQMGWRRCFKAQNRGFIRN